MQLLSEQIKYYLEGFRYGGEKYSDHSQNELNEIRTIFGKSDDAIQVDLDRS